MAEEPVTKWWAVGAKEEVTARKYISFLHKHSMFGGHVGLPENIRNEDPNRSLDSSRGIYDMVEVYSLSGTSCPTGTVVNFLLDNPVNPLGKTYVYPCNDISKPMGYMITKAEPNIWGVCVVSGILEVPLIYLRDTSSAQLERKDYVEYDLESKAFKFSDSGYPVFNVYQDVDGDWIAIILFGNDVSDYKYDGPFATYISGVTGGTTFVGVLGGDVLFNDVRDTCDDLDNPIAVSTGESLWLETSIVGSTHSYSFISNTTMPIDGSTVFYTKIAENNDGEIRQRQYGDIRYSRTKLISGSTNVHITPSSGLGDVTISVDESGGGGGGSSEFYTPPYGALNMFSSPPDGLGVTFIEPVAAGTVGFFDDGGGAVAAWSDLDGVDVVGLTNGVVYPTTEKGWLRVSVVDGGTANGACLSMQDSKGNMPLYKYGSFTSGSTVSPFVYDGPFAIKVDHHDTTTPTKLWVTRKSGDIVCEGVRNGVNADTSPKQLESGDSYWLVYNFSNNSSQFYRQSSEPAYSGDKICVKLAENIGGVLHQVQYGEIVVYLGVKSLTPSGNNVSITSGGSAATRGDLTIGVTGGTGGGGDGFPIEYHTTQPQNPSALSDGYVEGNINTRYVFAYMGSIVWKGNEWFHRFFIDDVNYNCYLTDYTNECAQSNPNVSYDTNGGYGWELRLPEATSNCMIEVCVLAYSNVLVTASSIIKDAEGSVATQIGGSSSGRYCFVLHHGTPTTLVYSEDDSVWYIDKFDRFY